MKKVENGGHGGDGVHGMYLQKYILFFGWETITFRILFSKLGGGGSGSFFGSSIMDVGGANLLDPYGRTFLILSKDYDAFFFSLKN